MKRVLTKVKDLLTSCFGRSQASIVDVDDDPNVGDDQPALSASAVQSGINTPTGCLTSSVSRNDTPSSSAPQNVALPDSDTEYDDGFIFDDEPFEEARSQHSSSGLHVPYESRSPSRVPSPAVDESGYGGGSELTESMRTRSRASSQLAPPSVAYASSGLQSRRTSPSRSSSRSSQNRHRDIAPSQSQDRAQAQEHEHGREQEQEQDMSLRSPSIGPASSSPELPPGLNTSLRNAYGQPEEQARPHSHLQDSDEIDEPTSPQTITPHTYGLMRAGSSSSERASGSGPLPDTTLTGEEQSQTRGETNDIDEPTSPQTITPRTVHDHSASQVVTEPAPGPS